MATLYFVMDFPLDFPQERKGTKIAKYIGDLLLILDYHDLGHRLLNVTLALFCKVHKFGLDTHSIL